MSDTAIISIYLAHAHTYHVRVLPLHPAEIGAGRVYARAAVHSMGIIFRIHQNGFYMALLMVFKHTCASEVSAIE
jgi:hypothetical protein